ncbi:hypothetical protein AAEO57_10140 [Flavobacterium sp. DGU38]|uniref:Polyketide cyclase / dehydrase and lipid transport n=1 Tax=Flavobacterium calami TaxID=3139144 RepID=A0ABU9IP20_9FLAO
MKTQTIHCGIILQAPLPLVFEAYFELDHLKIFRDFPYLGGFDYAEPKKEYFKAGHQHWIYFKDGSSAVRKINTFFPGLSFSAVVYHFSSLRFKGLYSIEYSFNFSEGPGNTGSRISCKYDFRFRSGLWALIFEAFAKEMISKNIDAFLQRTAENMQFRGLSIN